MERLLFGIWGYTPGPASSGWLAAFWPGASRAAFVSAAVGALDETGPFDEFPEAFDVPGPVIS